MIRVMWQKTFKALQLVGTPAHQLKYIECHLPHHSFVQGYLEQCKKPMQWPAASQVINCWVVQALSWQIGQEANNPLGRRAEESLHQSH